MEVKASKTSLIGMIVGTIFSAILFAIIMYKFITIPDFTITISEALALILISFSPSAPFCPVYISIIVDKIKEMKELKVNNA